LREGIGSLPGRLLPLPAPERNFGPGRTARSHRRFSELPLDLLVSFITVLIEIEINEYYSRCMNFCQTNYFVKFPARFLRKSLKFFRAKKF